MPFATPRVEGAFLADGVTFLRRPARPRRGGADRPDPGGGPTRPGRKKAALAGGPKFLRSGGEEGRCDADTPATLS